ncbi:MAG: tryptophan synthase subunit alpha [Chloroflexi bacterium]|nr:tryptophan synthase subunit alpha [Chloroflexota bacterium]MDP6496902.1 tryptophan synthase subunit alpha [Dehalococcoidia bacterium]MQG10181.1 tryptophan synthase subunit alpha [SAR202 cluster bacterium]MQG54023.1 tryptophan synthase subunit alpha [SAR202 cluster bacterium]
MGEPRIRRMFDAVREQKRPGLIVFVTAGFPDIEATLELVPALVAAGADAVELGVPFSDPLAEGPVIQESSFLALQNGTSLEDCLTAAETVREKIPDTPLILMGYYNPIHTYGLAPFTQRCQEAGVDGLIAVDLPGFEAAPLLAECRSHDISMIPLLAPTSTDESIKGACAEGSGFVYCISVTGVTGAREQVSGRSFELLDRVRAHTDLPLAVGFGISNRTHVEEVGETAEAAVVGSALVRVMLDSPREQLVERASRFVAELAGVSLPS